VIIRTAGLSMYTGTYGCCQQAKDQAVLFHG
jgi:hypothetical protein